jgi:UDP-GlcNAc:undecaprenyl-phosphate GlcNAc-1-phosphate transferase
LAYWFSLVVVPALVLSLALLTTYLGGLRVLAAPAAPGGGRAITRVMVELTYRRRILEVILDFFVTGIAYYLAFLTRYGLRISAAGLDLYLNSLPVALGCTLLSFFIFGIYRGVWRYISLDDLARLLKAALVGVALAAAAVWALFSMQAYPPVLFLLFAIYLFLGLAATRSSFRFLDRVSSRQRRAAQERVLICGAGAAGEVALRWILSDARLEFRPVGILDDDPFLAGRQIHGVDVLGGLEQLEAILGRSQVDGVIVTGEALENGALLEKVAPACRKHGCWVRSLRLEFELLE